MKSYTAYRDHLPRGQSFPIGLETLNSMVPDKHLAVYFISTATWVRLVYPMVNNEWPVIRVQKMKPMLRVRNDKVKSTDHPVDYYVIIYAVPSSSRKVVLQMIKNVAKNWNQTMRENQVLFYSRDGARIEHKLPDWI